MSKTGLGSSAALTTSLVASLLDWFGVVHLGSPLTPTLLGDLQIIHNVAQLAHSIAPYLPQQESSGGSTAGSIIGGILKS